MAILDVTPVIARNKVNELLHIFEAKRELLRQIEKYQDKLKELEVEEVKAAESINFKIGEILRAVCEVHNVVLLYWDWNLTPDFEIFLEEGNIKYLNISVQVMPSTEVVAPKNPKALPTKIPMEYLLYSIKDVKAIERHKLTIKESKWFGLRKD